MRHMKVAAKTCRRAKGGVGEKYAGRICRARVLRIKCMLVQGGSGQDVAHILSAVESARTSRKGKEHECLAIHKDR